MSVLSPHAQFFVIAPTYFLLLSPPQCCVQALPVVQLSKEILHILRQPADEYYPMMSEEDNMAKDTSCCASCGIAGIDDIKLMPCDDCDLVRYCSDECKENHKSEHEEDCKKRAAELRDDLLFKQPEGSYLGDCPICTLPLSLDKSKSINYECCNEVICRGCEYANDRREMELRLAPSCPFCRQALPDTEEEYDKQRMKRIEANDPAASRQQGHLLYNKGDYSSAFEYWTKAATLGDAEAHYQVSVMYHHGLGVEQNKEKEIDHLEKAAIVGHPDARYNLGCHENNNGNIERAVKHWIIAATQGEDDSIKALMDAFKKGHVEKEDLATTLRAHQAAVDATNSPQREEAKKA